MVQSGEMYDLEVSGVTFRLSKDLLCSVPDSTLGAMFSGRHAIPLTNGKVVLDRDPQAFERVVQFLRLREKMPEISDLTSRLLFETEMDYWCLSHAMPALSEYEQSLQDLLSKPPLNSSATIKKQFEKFGPLRLNTLK